MASEHYYDFQEPPYKERLTRRFLETYGRELKQCLDDFTEGGTVHHSVALLRSPLQTIVRVTFLKLEQPATVTVEFSFKLEEAYSAFLTFDQHSATFAHPSLLHYWSNVQAWIDAGEIIATVLTRLYSR